MHERWSHENGTEMEKRGAINREDSCEAGGPEPRPVEKAAVECADKVPDGFYHRISGLSEQRPTSAHPVGSPSEGLLDKHIKSDPTVIEQGHAVRRWGPSADLQEQGLG